MFIKVHTNQSEKEGYSKELCNSVHFSYSLLNDKFNPLNKEYGILFAEGFIDSNNTIIQRSVCRPCIFRIPSYGYGIAAIFCDNLTPGAIAYWYSKDLITFSSMLTLQLKSNENVFAVNISFDLQNKRYEVEWQNEDGITFINYFNDYHSFLDLTSPFIISEGEEFKCNNIISVDKRIGERVISKWSPYEVASSKNSMPFGEFSLASGWADPQIFKYDNDYYFIATNDNTDDIGLYLRANTTIEGLFQESEPVLILDVDKEKQFIQNFWAPEMHLIDGKLYILFAVSGDEFGPQCHLMRLKEGGSPMNASDWDQPIRVCKQDGSFLAECGITLDMTYFECNNSSYLVWSYRKNIFSPTDTGSMLYIASVDKKKPWVLTSDPILLSRPLLGWENIDGTINNEGPFAYISNGKVWIAYSGGSAGGNSYAIGLLYAEKDSDLLNILNWSKHPTPVVSSYTYEGEYGPGHNSFYVENNEIYNVYHAKEAFSNSPRCTGIRRVQIDEDGDLRFDIKE